MKSSENTLQVRQCLPKIKLIFDSKILQALYLQIKIILSTQPKTESYYPYTHYFIVPLVQESHCLVPDCL